MHKKTITIEESNKIVSLVEQILTKKKLQWGYRLSDLQGYSRIDIKNGFRLQIAEIYWNYGLNAHDNPDIEALIKAMDTSLMFIAIGGIPDSEIDKLAGQPDLPKLFLLAKKWSLISSKDDSETIAPLLISERKIFAEMEKPSEFAEFCNSLMESGNTNYWEIVYKHIGLEYHGDSTKKTVQPSTKPKLHKGCLLITLSLAMLLFCIYCYMTS